MARSSSSMDDKIGGLQKAAILLITLGPEKSALIFKHLKEEEIEELTKDITKGLNEIGDVLDEHKKGDK